MKFMDNKGQMSVEYLLIVLVVILVLSIVTIPLISNSIDASNDISHSSDAKVAASTIADAADTVYANGPHSKRTVDFYIPSNTTYIKFEGNKLIIPVILSNGTTQNVNATVHTAQYGLVIYDNVTHVPIIKLDKGWYEAMVSCEESPKQINVSVSSI